jgi:acetyl esterase/lipase
MCFPSYAYSIREDFLSVNMLDYSYKAYGKNYLENAHEIFLLNPIATPKEILSKFPPTRIMGGTYDPLRDSYILFFM